MINGFLWFFFLLGDWSAGCKEQRLIDCWYCCCFGFWVLGVELWFGGFELLFSSSVSCSRFHEDEVS